MYEKITENKFVKKIINQLIFRYLNIRNLEISEYRSFYIWSFQILYLSRLKVILTMEHYIKLPTIFI